MNSIDLLRSLGAVVENDHFVFKAGYAHGDLYINKEEFIKLGANNLIKLLGNMVDSAVKRGLEFGDAKEIGVVGPGYGAIPYALPVAGFLEDFFPGIKFFPARTQLKNVNGRDVHYLPEKLIKQYRGKRFIGVEDIVNNGETIREIRDVFSMQANADVDDFMSIANRGVQTAQTLGLKRFFPLMDPTLKQYDLRVERCLKCFAEVPINTQLGKGAEWVKMFGQPPYPVGKDFSAFWEKRK
jgi:orotate phosphoribosyltransferase